MANPKQKGAAELPDDRPVKRQKTTHRRREESNHPPQFWDDLSKVWLTRRALRELDRRNRSWKPIPVRPAVLSRDLARFARRGGPDLRHLRGCPEPTQEQGSRKMASRSGSSRRSALPSTNATTDSSATNATATAAKIDAKKKTRKSSAYDFEFEQHLVDHNIYPDSHWHEDGRPRPRPTNGADYARLSAPRPSLSPSRFSESQFEDFMRKDIRAIDETDVMADVMPVIFGNADILSKRNMVLTELKEVGPSYEKIVRPQPDLFDGASRQDLEPALRDPNGRLRGFVVPTKHAKAPVAPNFFLEAKGPNGSARVAELQACYDGAYGVRAMHSLQNYGDEEPEYDEKINTLSATYGSGVLNIFGHWSSRPATPDGRPDTHMRLIKTCGLRQSRDSLAEGATAFRNARDWAKDIRDTTIRDANSKVRAHVPGPEELPQASRQAEDTPVAEEPGRPFIAEGGEPVWQSANHALPAGPDPPMVAQDGEPVWQGGSHLPAGQDPFGAQYGEPVWQGANHLPAGLDYLVAQDGEPAWQNANHPLPAGSNDLQDFTSTFAPSSHAPSRSKRSRESPPHSAAPRAQKTRQARREEKASATVSNSEPPAPEGRWVTLHRRGNYFCFSDMGQLVWTEPSEWVDAGYGSGDFCWQSSDFATTFWSKGLPA